jgi:predicted TPR repeat methyltransferase
MKKETTTSDLWTPRSVEDTIAVYQNWADTYDAELAKLGYLTPGRMAEALVQYTAPETPILDFGCGTGLSGAALKSAGFTQIDGTDITPEMLDKAQARQIYRKLWQGTPGSVGITAGSYSVIFAAGVISLGAAPAGMLHVLIEALPKQGLLVLSYNEPTLADESYINALDVALAQGSELVFRESGAHLTGKNMSSDVIILRKV